MTGRAESRTELWLLDLFCATIIVNGHQGIYSFQTRAELGSLQVQLMLKYMGWDYKFKIARRQSSFNLKLTSLLSTLEL